MRFWRHGLFAVVSIALVPGARAQDPRAADRSALAAMRSDLRNLVVAEESFFANHARYTRSLDSLTFRPSPGVMVTIDQASGRGWRATARRVGAAGQCSIFVGSAPKPQQDAREGEPACDGAQVVFMPPDSADVRAVLPMFGEMMSNVWGNMYDQMTQALARPETAERLATFARNYYEALIRHGFTREEALQLTAAMAVPSIR